MRDSFKILALVLCVANAALCQDAAEGGGGGAEGKEEGKEEECPEYVCPEQHGSFADPCECRRFYKCNHGVPTRLLCPSSEFEFRLQN